jgi:membrane fusion protein (multidrug efflux system)
MVSDQNGGGDRKKNDVLRASQLEASAATTLPVEPLRASSSAEKQEKQPNDAGQAKKSPRRKRWLLWLGAAILAVVAAVLLWPIIWRALNTVSTDDAYVNGHFTFVAPRVSGQVVGVLVDDNNRVRKGDLLVQLDPEPYQIQVSIKQAAVAAARANLDAAKSQVAGLEAMGDAQRWQLQAAMERVASQIATLRANVASYHSRKASLALALANQKRGEELAPAGAMSKEELDVRRETVKVNEQQVHEALEMVYATRAALGLMDRPVPEDQLDAVPADLEQTYSTVQAAFSDMLQTAAQIGLKLPTAGTGPREFLQRYPREALAQKLRELGPNAPAVKQAQTRLAEAEHDLAQAQLNLDYTNVYSEIDGVVTRRSVNPGNNVQAGQSVMAVRSLTEIWIDANFKETQLAYLRIGQRVDMKVDMYGRSVVFPGRITGFTMGTGSTLALLPAENATGNFIKVVQRLPVRIEPVNYDPNSKPLFLGLSVVPYVYVNEPATGPHAGEYLQPLIQSAPRAEHASAVQP